MRTMSYQRGPDRSQVQFLPPCLEDYVSANSPVRFMEAFVEGLDLKQLGFQRAEPADTGRPAYDPADLLKLYLYGYLNRIRSSRRLEAESQRNQELIKKIEERIEAYLQQLDQQDAEAEGVSAKPSGQGLEQKLEKLRQCKGQYEEYIAEMIGGKQREVFLTDPQSRAQKRVGTGYNVQVAVDAKHDLIVEPEVVQDANDLGQLSGMAQVARDALEVRRSKL